MIVLMNIDEEKDDDELTLSKKENEKKLFESYLKNINTRFSNGNVNDNKDEIDVEKLCEMQKRVIDVIKKNGIRKSWLNPKYELSYMIKRRNERIQFEKLLNGNG